MTNIDIVPATDSLVISFYGEIPPKTLNAIAAVRGDEVLGIAGIFKAGMVWIMFSDFKPEILKDKRAMVKAVRASRKLIAGIRLPVYAIPQEGIEGAEKLIKHVGVGLWQSS